MRSARRMNAALAMAALSVLVGCTTVVSGSAVKAPGAANVKSSACEDVSTLMTPIEQRAPGEPQLRIPQPQGWQRTKMLDSEVIRYAMGNKALTANDFSPTAVVTLESGPGTDDQQKIFDEERSALVDRLGATDLSTTTATLCGHGAEIVDYTAPPMGRIPPRKVKTLMVAARFGDSTYVATVTIQGTDPGNSTYARDANTILTGFQMLPPGAG